MKSKTALDWLLEKDQPAVRHLALTQVLEKAGKPSKMITLRAMRVLKELGDSR